MKQRTITAIAFAAVMLGGIYSGPNPFFALFLFIGAGCAWELGDLCFKTEPNFTFLRKTICVALVMLLYIAFVGETWGFFNLPLEAVVMAAILLFSILATLELFLAGEKPFYYLGTYFLAVFYIGIPLVLLALMAHGEEYSPNRVLGLLLLVWTNDTGAYIFGKRFGKHKLFARISPNKTWEGSLGGGVFAILVAWGLSFVFDDFTRPQWLALSLTAAIGSNIGDLVESMLKRSVGVKDSGSLLPGHGGLLDRFDAFIFCLPWYWLVLQLN